MWLCIKCGKRSGDEENICPSCGADAEYDGGRIVNLFSLDPYRVVGWKNTSKPTDRLYNIYELVVMPPEKGNITPVCTLCLEFFPRGESCCFGMWDEGTHLNFGPGDSDMEYDMFEQIGKEILVNKLGLNGMERDAVG